MNSEFNGYIGIKPYVTLKEEDRITNVLYRLKQNKFIDHIIVSIYDDLREGNNSLIKVGGWD
jgi:hypothetical protein